MLVSFPPSVPLNYQLACAVAVLVFLGRRSRFRVGYSAQSHMGTPAMLVGALLLDPSTAVLAVGAGVLADEILPGGWSRSRLFNLGQSPLQVLVAVGVLSVVGWDPAAPMFDDPLMLGGAFLAGALAIATSAVLVSTSEWFETGGSLPSAVWRVVYGGGSEVILSDVSKICFGIVAALLVDITLWFIVLLIVPVATMSQALSRAGRLRGRLEAALRDTEHTLADAQRLANLGSWTLDLSGGEPGWSEQIYDICGLDPAEITPSPNRLRELLAPGERPLLDEAIQTAVQRGIAVEFDHDIHRPDGELRHVHHRIKVIAGPEPAGGRLVGTVHDITERKQLERQFRYLAYHDGLTGLPNRDLFIERLADALMAGDAASRGDAVLFFDLDHFKSINDRYGHEAGDAVLIEVAHRLRMCVDPSDTVARLSGDEFTILATGDGGARRIEDLAARILDALREPVLACGASIHLTASAGIVYVEPRHRSPSDLLRESDKSLYHAKGSGRGRYMVYALDLLDGNPEIMRRSA